VQSESSDGLITRLAKAMYDKKDLFLVYDKAVGVLREADQTEQAQIKEEYKSNAQSKTGVYISFKNYVRSDMLKLYSGLEYCTIGSLNKSMNLTKAIQIKLADLRKSVGAVDSDAVKKQAQSMAKSLSEGKDIYMDGGDSIETAKADLSATKESITFLDAKRSFYLGMPASYINGEQTGGMGTTGENDTKATERGLKNYYFSIIKPVVEAVFGASVTYKSQDFRQITQACTAMKDFSLAADDYITWENQKKIIEGLLDIDADDNKLTPPKEVKPPAVTVVPPAAPAAVTSGAKQ
jgi:hypothetical protein